MKILVTGMTRVQAGGTPKLEYVSTPKIIVEVLRNLGHDVSHKPHDGEEYDLYIIGMAPSTSIASGHTYTTYRLLDHLTKTGGWRGRVGFYIDDWNVGGLDASLQTPAKRLIHLPLWGGRKNQDWAAQNEDDVMNVQALLRGTWPSTLVPMFRWGSPDILFSDTSLKSTRWHPIDPSSVAPRMLIEDLSRERRPTWVHAALTRRPSTKWLKAQGSTGDVLNIGGKGERLTEAQVQRLYPYYRGVLSPPYKHAGSGWWRVRYLHAADAMCVLGLDPLDSEPMPASFRYSLGELEQMSNSEWRETAEQQRMEMAINTESYAVLVDRIANFVEYVQ